VTRGSSRSKASIRSSNVGGVLPGHAERAGYLAPGSHRGHVAPDLAAEHLIRAATSIVGVLHDEPEPEQLGRDARERESPAPQRLGVHEARR
jgi:hypothetical protein